MGHKGDWDDYITDVEDQESGVLTPEVEAAFALAERVTEPVEIVPRRESNVGDKRRIRHGKWSREPLDGCTIERSNMLRDIVALRFGGNALREAFKKVAENNDIIPNTVEKYYYRNPEAIKLAEEEHLTSAIAEYHTNLWAVRTMMSEAGPQAIKTIIEVMKSRKSSPNVKLKAAQAILKMMDVDGSANANPNESIAKESLRLVRDVMNKRSEGQTNSVIVEATDAEFEEGNERDN